MPGRPHHDEKWQRCVQEVSDKSPDKNAYAICTAQLGPSIEASEGTTEGGEPEGAPAGEGLTETADPAGDAEEARLRAAAVEQQVKHSGPSQFSARCALCGRDRSLRDMQKSASYCVECFEKRHGHGLSPLAGYMRTSRMEGL